MLLKAMVDRFVAPTTAEFADKDIEKAFLIRERPEPGQWVDVVPGGSCPTMALLFLSALPRRHKRFWKVTYEEKDVQTGAKDEAKCLCVDISINAVRLFRFLEDRDFSGGADSLRDQYLAEEISR